MNNPFLKSNKNAFKFCIAFLIAFVSVLYSCRKDHVNQTANPQALTTIDAHIPQLKELYANGVKAHSKATQSTGKWYNDLINSIEVDWDSYTLQKRNDSSIVAEFEMKNDSGLYTLKQLDGKYRNKTTVVFIEKKDGSRLSFFAKVIEDLSIPGSGTVLDELHYRNIPGLFNGMIFYYTLDRQFVNGERYVNGVRTGSVSFNEATGGVRINSIKTNSAAAPCTITDFYSYNCQQLPSGELIDCRYKYIGTITTCDDGDGGGYGYGGDGSGGGVPADPKPCIPAKPNTVDMTEVVKNGKLVIQSMPAPGTGGGTTPTPTPVPCPTTPPPPVLEEIVPGTGQVNGAKDPDFPSNCASWAYMQVSNGNYQVCGVNDLRFDYITEFQNSQGKLEIDYFRAIYSKTIYFEFPKKRVDGTIITSSEAARLTALAKDNAEEILESQVESSPPPQSNTETQIMLNRYLNILRNQIQSYGGRITTNNNYGTTSVRTYTKGIGGC